MVSNYLVAIEMLNFMGAKLPGTDLAKYYGHHLLWFTVVSSTEWLTASRITRVQHSVMFGQ